MNAYIPNTKEDQEKMLSFIGLKDIGELFSCIPDEVLLSNKLSLESSKSEFEVLKKVDALAKKNRPASEMTCFLGAGVYDRLIPSVIKHIIGRQEFLTAYTPYQPEISQGTLQAIFEFQTMVCSLFGMDTANASLYDGASSCAEAMLLAVGHTGEKRLLVSNLLHPEARDVVLSYARYNGIVVEFIPEKDGLTDLTALEEMIKGDAAGVLIQTPNFLGGIEDLASAAEIAHREKALLLSYTADLMSLALIESPGACGADIAVGEGQSFGIGMNFGGPHLGLMAVKQPFTRKLPGRIVGQTKDVSGKRAYTLTLQTREQHIRREKATSNICTNQNLNALAFTCYLSLLGTEGLLEAASQSYTKAHYLKDALSRIGVKPFNNAPFFCEFAATLPVPAKKVAGELLKEGYLLGLPLSDWLKTIGKVDADDGTVLFCVTEKRTKEEIDSFTELVGQVCDRLRR